MLSDSDDSRCWASVSQIQSELRVARSRYLLSLAASCRCIARTPLMSWTMPCSRTTVPYSSRTGWATLRIQMTSRPWRT